MKDEQIDAVALKRDLQSKAEQKLVRLAEKEQLELLRRRFGHLTRRSRKQRAQREQKVA